MADTPSWRDLLRDIINEPNERDRIASAIGVRPITLTRWVNGESKPRPRNISQLLQALPQQQRDRLRELLNEEYIEVFDLSTSDQSDEIEYKFVMQVLELRATTSDNLLFWTLCRKVLLQALRRLDPERIGMAITLVQCMPLSSNGKVHSLRESMGVGTSPWQDDLEQQSIFLGAESLAGYVVARCHPMSVQDLRIENMLLPAYQTEYEVSATAFPILYATRVAGCLLVSSTQPNYFLLKDRLALIHDYARLIGLAFTPEQFYPAEKIDLHFMPPAEVQRTYFVTFQQRVTALMRQAFNASRPLTRMQAEQLVWQQLEEELIHHRYNRS